MGRHAAAHHVSKAARLPTEEWREAECIASGGLEGDRYPLGTGT
jgi:hypothetical protein